MTPAPIDRTKLARILGMLGSDHAGERAAAGLKAMQVVKASGLTWEQVLQPIAAISPEPRQQSQRGDFGVTAELRLCRRCFAHLTRWEQDFIASVETRAKLSERQVGVLQRIADRFRDRGFS